MEVNEIVIISYILYQDILIKTLEGSWLAYGILNEEFAWSLLEVETLHIHKGSIVHAEILLAHLDFSLLPRFLEASIQEIEVVVLSIA